MPHPPVHIIRFWKPYGVLTQFTDPAGRPTLADYIPLPGIYAAGRLDFDSEGLLLLTDSGPLQARLTDPAYEHPRTYLVQVERLPASETLQRMRDGIDLNDGRTRPAQVELLEAAPDLPERPVPIRFRKNVPTAWLRMTLTEGRKHQIRRMTAALGHPTLRLVRAAIGPISLDGLAPGQWLPLTAEEMAALQRSLKRRRIST